MKSQTVFYGPWGSGYTILGKVAVEGITESQRSYNKHPLCDAVSPSLVSLLSLYHEARGQKFIARLHVEKKRKMLSDIQTELARPPLGNVHTVADALGDVPETLHRVSLSS